MADPAREDELQLAREAIESWNRGNVDAVMAALDDEVEVYVPEGLMGQATYDGKEGFVAWATQWNEAWESFVLEVETVELIGDRHVLATVMQRGRGRGSGLDVELRMHYLFEVRGGLCTRLALHPERDGAIAIAREREREGEG